MVLAIGFRVRSKRGTQFRIWANHHLKEYMVKGFVMDDERLKNPDGRPDYFDELLERIREILINQARWLCNVTLDAENWAAFQPQGSGRSSFWCMPGWPPHCP